MASTIPRRTAVPPTDSPSMPSLQPTRHASPDIPLGWNEFTDITPADAELNYFHEPPYADLEDEVAQPIDEGNESDWSDVQSEGGDVPLVSRTAERVDSKRGVLSDNPASDWFPYQTRGDYTTYLIFSGHRTRFAENQQKAVLSYARCLGAKEVPSWRRYKAIKQEIRKLKAFRSSVTKQKSSIGTIYYQHELVDIVGRDFANHSIRKHIGKASNADSSPDTHPDYLLGLYPRDCQGAGLSQAWEANKFLFELDEKVATPMIRLRDTKRDFFVHELLECSDQTWFWPVRWVLGDRDKMFAEGFRVQRDPDNVFRKADDARVRISVTEFRRNFEEFKGELGDSQIHIDSAEAGPVRAHPLREIAGGRMVLSVAVILAQDDVSGNQSKQWSKHFCIYMNNGCLPREELLKESNVHFVGTSTFASPNEMMQGVRSSIRSALERPSVARDAATNDEIMLRVWPMFLPADNPMAAEHSCGAGLQSNFFCRTCGIGGTKDDKRSPAGYESLFHPGELRNQHSTLETIRGQYDLARTPRSNTKIKKMSRETGVKDSFASVLIDRLIALTAEVTAHCRSKKMGTKAREAEVDKAVDAFLLGIGSFEDITNPLLSMPGLDVHKDTPTEILHTVLLGVVKYFWSFTYGQLAVAKKLDTFLAHLNAVDVSGLGLPKIDGDYICRYRGGLIGKHFKLLAQVMCFATMGLVTDQVRNGWILIGELVTLLWRTKIDELESYIDKLTKCILNFLSVMASCAPLLVVTKAKAHLLVHVPYFIRRFGPAILFSSERFESFHRIFRLCSIHSNRQSPSKDIAYRFLELELCRHIATGGWWLDEKLGWVRSSPRLQEHLIEYPDHARMLGIRAEVPIVPGEISNYIQETLPDGKKGRKAAEIQYSESSAYSCQASRFPTLPTLDATSLCRKASQLICQNEDKASIGSKVAVRLEGGELSPLAVGELHEILFPLGARVTDVIVTLNMFDIDSSVTSKLRMPCLKRTSNFASFRTQDIIAVVNVQHDCDIGRCYDQLGSAPIRQERVKTRLTRAVLEHKDSNHYILNTSALHNNDLIRELSSSASDQSPVPLLSTDEASKLRHEARKIAADKQMMAKLARQAKKHEVLMGRASLETLEEAEKGEKGENGDLLPDGDPLVEAAAQVSEAIPGSQINQNGQASNVSSKSRKRSSTTQSTTQPNLASGSGSTQRTTTGRKRTRI